MSEIKVTTVSFTKKFLEKIDARAKELGLSRTAYLVFACNFEMSLNKEVPTYEEVAQLSVA
ncbi:MAG: hypothetical protein QXJ06_03035 [Candidatus Aenigmatarchaeota archaeon]